MSNKTIAVVAGKSGGHIIPGMTYARNYTAADPAYRVHFFSSDTALDRSIIALYPTVYYIPLNVMPIPGKRFWLYPLFFMQFVRAFFISYKQLRYIRPDHVMSMGGYISLPVCLAARMLKIPFDLYELNAVPGKAVVWLAPLARKIYVCFDEARAYFKPHKVVVSSYPLRFGVGDSMPKVRACMQLGLDETKKTLAILGGSQGSRSINELMKTFFKAHPQIVDKVQVIHQAGSLGVQGLKDFYRELGISALVYDYDHKLEYTYSAADLIIARAGAGSLFEIAFFKKRGIIVPLELSSTDHQVDNAYALQAVDKRQAAALGREPLFTVVKQREIQADPAHFYKIILQAIL